MVSFLEICRGFFSSKFIKIHNKEWGFRTVSKIASYQVSYVKYLQWTLK